MWKGKNKSDHMTTAGFVHKHPVAYLGEIAPMASAETATQS